MPNSLSEYQRKLACKIIEEIKVENGLTLSVKQVTSVIDSQGYCIKYAIEHGRDIKIDKVGSFIVSKKKIDKANYIEDLINKGYSKEEAILEYRKHIISINNGTI